MQNLAYQFAFKCNAIMSVGFNHRTSLEMTASEFKRSITAIAIRKRIDNEKSHRRYYFNDGTVCTFQNGGFLLGRRINQLTHKILKK